jgi:hypothetical protein
MKELKVGDRVRVYATLNGTPAETRGVIEDVEDRRLYVALETGPRIFAHPKQCRRLRPAAPRREVFVSISPAGIVGRTSVKPFEGAVRFVEAKEKA